MENRKIIIVDSAANRKIEIETAATTFGELKAAAVAAGVNVANKDWLEGITKTSPRSDDSLLPTNVNYHGTITNNLVYMLTNTNKQIRSGAMNRAEIIKFIKVHHLENDVKSKYGKNYTNCSTVDLQKVVDSYTKKNASPVNEAHTEGKTNTTVNNSKNDDNNDNSTINEFKFISSIITFFKSLPKKVQNIVVDNLKEVEFSDKEINDLFK